MRLAELCSPLGVEGVWWVGRQAENFFPKIEIPMQ